jgi:hypothetical protein
MTMMGTRNVNKLVFTLQQILHFFHFQLTKYLRLIVYVFEQWYHEAQDMVEF